MADNYTIEKEADNKGNVFDYILAEETFFKTMPIPVNDSWQWSMYEHITKSTLYKYGQLSDGNPGMMKPVKNIVYPVLSVAYRTEGFDVKDIEPYVNDADNFHKSFLVRKFHPKWARKYSIDTFIDNLVESVVDFDLVLVKNVNEERPEVVPLGSLAFCDQTDILSGSICIKHSYSVDQLKDMTEVGWYEDAINSAILNATSTKDTNAEGQQAKTTGKNIDVYELHGVFPGSWLDEESNTNEYSRQIHIVTYTKGTDNKKNGLCLFKSKTKNVFKSLVINKIHGRACGYGGVEALFHPQIWTNYNMIQIKEMLDVASMMLLQTSDPAYGGNKKLTDKQKGEILSHKEGMPLTQVNIQPINMQQFENAVIQWEQQARTIGFANDAVLGQNPTAGTPFKLQELVVNQNNSTHEYRKGKIALFVGEIYRDWVLDYLVKEMNRGDKWIEELSLEEMQWVAERLSLNKSNDRIKELILEGKMVTKEEQGVMIQLIKDTFMKDGNKKFLELVKAELKDLPMDVYINVAGKQKDLSKMTDKLVNIFRTVIQNPQVLAQPAISKIFNQILESSGLSPVDFSGLTEAPQPQAIPEAQPIQSPLQEDNQLVS